MPKTKEKKITARMVLDLLVEKHAQDVFVSECKNGASYGGGLLKLDAWTMNRSWANACATGYEIKVNRGDFMQDKKWHGYLEYCNEFYFVCPTGVIKVEEVPEAAGLMYVSKTGTRLFRKKKAPYRQLQIPESLYMYVLMARAKIDKERNVQSISTADYWESWLKEKEENTELGWRVSKRVKKIVDRYQEIAVKAKRKVEEYSTIRERIVELGFDPDERHSSWKVKRKLDELAGVVPRHFEQNLRDCRDELKKVYDFLYPEKDTEDDDA